jgi:ankyrin repeat protein
MRSRTPEQQQKLNKQLLKHVKKGNAEKVWAALTKGADINATTKSGNTALQLATKRKLSSMVALLNHHIQMTTTIAQTPPAQPPEIEHPAKAIIEDVKPDTASLAAPLAVAQAQPSIPVINNAQLMEKEKGVELRGFTPLHYAAQDGDDATVLSLLRNRFYPNVTCGETGQTPLFIAAKFGHARVVKILLEHGASEDILDNQSYTPLGIAIKNKRTDVVKILRAGKAAPIVDAVSVDQMHTLLKNNQYHELEEVFIRDKNARGLFDVTSPLCDAVEIGSTEMVDMLLRHGAPLNKISFNVPDYTPLQLACSKGLFDIAAILISHGAEVGIENANGETAQGIAKKQDRIAALYLFDRDEWRLESLVKAVKYGTLDEVAKCLEVCPNFRKGPISYNGNGLLHFAAARGDVSICQFLINSGLPVDEKNSDHASPMALALQAGHDDVFMLLHEKGARLPYMPNQYPRFLDYYHVDVLMKHKALAFLFAEWVQYPECLRHISELTTIFSKVDDRLVAKLIFAFQHRSNPLPADAMKHMQLWCKGKIKKDGGIIIKTHLLNSIKEIPDLNERLRVCELALRKPEDNLLSFVVNVKKNILDPRECDTVKEVKLLAEATRQQLQDQGKVVVAVSPEDEAALADCQDEMNVVLESSSTPASVPQDGMHNNNNEYPSLSALVRHSHFAPAPESVMPLYPELPPPAYSTLLPQGYAVMPPPPSYESLLEENEVREGEDGNIRFVARSGQ